MLPSIVNDPPECQVRQLPKNLKIKIKQKLQKFNTKKNQSDIVVAALELLEMELTLDWKHCEKYINRLPSLRGEKLVLDDFIGNYLLK